MKSAARQGMYWVLQDHKPVMVNDLAAWVAWIEKHDATRRVAKDSISVPGHVGMCVSTVFLAINPCLGGGTSAPMLFESRVFGGPLDEEAWAYQTWEQAEIGHKALTEKVTMAAEITASKLREKLKELSKGTQ